MKHPPKYAGFALITALIFLVILTLVAITALRTSGLELRMGSNNALRTESFESSESPRLLLTQLLDVHTFNRGWPVSVGGGIPDGEFNYPFPVGLSLDSATPANWYVNNVDEAGNCESPFRAAGTAACTLRTDASYRRDLAAGGEQPFVIRSDLSVFKLRVDLAPGAGTAMLAGYEGTGKSIASSGGRVFFYVRSSGRDAAVADAGTEARTDTGTLFRHVIRN